jgi:ABC-2 type transport system permease protein
MSVSDGPSTHAASAARGTGVIHDIGYRGYSGPRLGASYIARSLFAQSLRGAFGLGRSARSKILPMVLFGAMCIPAVIIVAVAVTTKAKELPLEYGQYAVFLQAVVAIFLAAQAPQSVSRDLRYHTLPLYFSRPLSRSGYVYAKYLAMVSALFVLTAAPLVILYVGALLAKLDFADQTKAFAGALVGVALLSLLLAAIGLLIAALTPRRGFGVAGVIAVLALSYTAASALQAMADERGNLDAAGWLGLISPMTLFDGVQVYLFDVKSSGAAGPPGTTGGLVFTAVLLGLTALSLGLLLRRYKKVSAI